MISAVSRLYRTIFCRGGYGVHSPFAFDLITNVMEERGMYYCYEMLDHLRLQLQRGNGKIECGDKELTVKQAMRKYCFSTGGYKLLFRLANRFRPEKILIAGSGLGLTPLAIAAYSKNVDCMVLEPEPSIAMIARNMIKKYAHSSISVYEHNGSESELSELKPFDFIIWGKNGLSAAGFSLEVFEKMLRYVTDESVMVISGINASRADKRIWETLCAHNRVSMTFDLYSFGIVFFTPKLNRKTYKCIPL
jgi:predicted O-methyltransferase YrrM